MRVRDMLGKMRISLVALAAVLLTHPAEAGFKVCNKTPHDTKVALGLFDGSAWSSRGWWTVPAHACRELLPEILKARYYYVFATDGEAGTWDGKMGFCVSPADTFSIKGRADCESHGYERRGFFEVDTGQARDFTQTLSD